MAMKLPDPKTLVDSIATGAIEVLKTPARIATNIASVATDYAKEVESGMTTIQTQMPENPLSIPETAVKVVSQTAKAGLGLVDGVGEGLRDTVNGVRAQIERVL